MCLMHNRSYNKQKSLCNSWEYRKHVRKHSKCQMAEHNMRPNRWPKFFYVDIQIQRIFGFSRFFGFYFLFSISVLNVMTWNRVLHNRALVSLENFTNILEPILIYDFLVTFTYVMCRVYNIHISHDIVITNKAAYILVCGKYIYTISKMFEVRMCLL